MIRFENKTAGEKRRNGESREEKSLPCGAMWDEAVAKMFPGGGIGGRSICAHSWVVFGMAVGWFLEGFGRFWESSRMRFLVAAGSSHDGDSLP